MPLIDGPTGWKIAKFLGRNRYLFKPCVVKFDDPTAVEVIGDIAKVKLKGRVDRGRVLWFEGDIGTLEVPLPRGLPLIPEVTFRWDRERFVPVESNAVSWRIDLKNAPIETPACFRSGETVSVEIEVPCDTKKMLEESKERVLQDDNRITAFELRRKKAFEDVPIRNFEWRRPLSDLLPIRGVRVLKSGIANKDHAIDISKQSRATYFSSSLSLDRDGTPDDLGRRPIIGHPAKELVVPLSFLHPGDRFEIIFDHGL